MKRLLPKGADIRLRIGLGSALTGLMLSMAYMNCSQVSLLYQGGQTAPSVTSVGNPNNEENAKNLAVAICRKLTLCHSELNSEICWLGLMETPGIAEAAGLPGLIFSDFRGVLLAESRDQVSGSKVQVEACGENLNGLPCSDALVQNAFLATQPRKFDGVVSLIGSFPQTCGAALTCGEGGCPLPTLSPSLGPSPSLSPSPSPASTPSPSPSPASAGPSCAGTGTQFGLQYCRPDTIGGGVSGECCSGTWHWGSCVANDPYCSAGEFSCLQLCD